MKSNIDKWWALFLVIVCIFFSLNLVSDSVNRRIAASERVEIVNNQKVIIANEVQIMKSMGIALPTNWVVTEIRADEKR